MRSTWNFYTAGQLIFGAGAISELAAICQRHAWRRVLLVTDKTLANLGMAERIVAPLRSAGIETVVFDGGQAEPAIQVARDAGGLATDVQPDAVLGLGGGSNLDLAKITALLARHGGQPEDYFGFDRVPGPVVPLVGIPTTAGTGSEVSHAAVLTDTASEMKVSTLSNWLRPTVAVVDPELTFSCPPRVAAESGIDALTHAIEAYLATDFDKLPLPPGETCAYEGRFPLADCLAEKAIRLLGQNLVAAVQDADNRPAREQMALAATLAGMAFSNAGVALVHALEYPLGGALHCSHGAGNGLLLPYVMRFNLPERIEAMGRLGKLLGAPVDAMSPEAAAEEAIATVVRLREAIGIPLRIRELGGTADQLPGFAQKSFAIKRLLWINPRQASEQDLLAILKDAW